MKKFILFGMAVLLSLAIIGCSDDDISRFITNTPDAVTNLEARVYPGSVLLTWTPSINAMGYAIIRTDAAGNVKILTESVSASSVWYMDTLDIDGNNILVNGTNYTYTVRSYNMNSGGNVSTATASATANIPQHGTNLTGSWENVAGDFTFFPYNPVFNANSVADAIPTAVMITLAKANPLFSYEIEVRQHSSAFDTGASLDITQGTLLASVTFNPYNASEGNVLEDTMSSVADFQATFEQNHNRRVIVKYTLNSPYYKMNTTTAGIQTHLLFASPF